MTTFQHKYALTEQLTPLFSHDLSQMVVSYLEFKTCFSFLVGARHSIWATLAVFTHNKNGTRWPQSMAPFLHASLGWKESHRGTQRPWRAGFDLAMVSRCVSISAMCSSRSGSGEEMGRLCREEPKRLGHWTCEETQNLWKENSEIWEKGVNLFGGIFWEESPEGALKSMQAFSRPSACARVDIWSTKCWKTDNG